MKNVKYFVNLIAAFLWSVLLTVDQGKHGRLTWLIAISLLPIGIWLMRIDPPWWHGSFTLAALAAGRLCTNAWLNAHHLRSGPRWDDFVWVFAAISLFVFLTDLGKLRGRSKRQTYASGSLSQSN